VLDCLNLGRQGQLEALALPGWPPASTVSQLLTAVPPPPLATIGTKTATMIGATAGHIKFRLQNQKP